MFGELLKLKKSHHNYDNIWGDGRQMALLMSALNQFSQARLKMGNQSKEFTLPLTECQDEWERFRISEIISPNDTDSVNFW